MKWYGVLFLFVLSIITANFATVVRMVDNGVIRERRFVSVPVVKKPSVGLKTLSGEPAVFSKKPFLLVFFAVDCPYCKLFHGVLNDVAKDIPVVGIMTRPDKKGEFEKQIKQAGKNPYVFVGTDTTGEWSRAYRVYGIPVAFLVDGDKNLMRYEGAFTKEKYDTVIREQVLTFLKGEKKDEAKQ